jgi:hypothetical protein
MSEVLGTLMIELSANVARFQQEMRSAGDIATQSANRINSTFAGITQAASLVRVGGLVAGAVTGGLALASFAKSSLDVLDRLDDLSQKTSLSVEFLDQLQQLATRTGDSLEVAAGAAASSARTWPRPAAAMPICCACSRTWV